VSRSGSWSSEWAHDGPVSDLGPVRVAQCHGSGDRSSGGLDGSPLRRA